MWMPTNGLLLVAGLESRWVRRSIRALSVEPSPCWLAMLISFGRNAILTRHFSKRGLGRNLKIDLFSLHRQTTSFESLNQGPTSPVLARYRQVVSWPLCEFHCPLVCLFLLPLRSYHSCIVLFCCVYWVCAYLPRHGGCVGFWAYPTSFYSSMSWVLFGQKFLPVQSGHAGCQSYHVGPLGLLPLSLSFLGPFTLHLSLINPMGLLATIPTMLAYWVYYLYLWASPTHLLYLYLLLIPWTCQLPFLPCWPIGFTTSILGLPRPIYFTLTSLLVSFSPIFLIVGLLLPLRLLSKLGLNAHSF